MPELPEVEVVKLNLVQILRPPVVIKSWNFFRKDLRWPIPKKMLNGFAGSAIESIDRRGKFLLFRMANHTIISHLGMTGSWRCEKAKWLRRKHDHVAFQFSDEDFLVYEDPRRFGFIEVCENTKLTEKFQHLGSEPLSPAFAGTELTNRFRQLQGPIKSTLMNQSYVVGIGNIYASEILFAAGVHPSSRCSQVTLAKYELIWKKTQQILQAAIQGGGSSIDNYRNGFGEAGLFQKKHQVYGRENENCLVCDQKIKSKFMAGRNTFWCPHCQPRR